MSTGMIIFLKSKLTTNKNIKILKRTACQMNKQQDLQMLILSRFTIWKLNTRKATAQTIHYHQTYNISLQSPSLHKVLAISSYCDLKWHQIVEFNGNYHGTKFINNHAQANISGFFLSL